MVREALAVALLVTSAVVSASHPLEASLQDLACGADHILVGRVVGVDMVNSIGMPIRDQNARTGPGLRNAIRLHVEVLEIVESAAPEPPSLLKVPLDSAMHYSLGQVQAVYAEPSDPSLVFLRGRSFEPVIAGRSLWALSGRAEAIAIRAKCRK